jgi:hypothetical protein
MIMVFFLHVKLYAAMGRGLFGSGFNSPIELCCQKLETENQ